MDKKQDLHPYENDLLPFDPIVIVRDVMHQWLLILTIALIFGVGAFIVSKSTYQPRYQTSTTLVVTARDSSSSIYDNIDYAGNLATVFTEILNSSVLEDKILQKLNMPEFDGTIQANLLTDTNLLTLTVQGNDPRTVFLVTEAILENHEMITYKVIGDVVIEVLQYPTVPVGPVNDSSASRMMKLVGFIAAITACALLAIFSYNRDTIRSRKEAEKKLNCWCLGELQHEVKNKTFRDRFRRKKKSILVTKPETSFRYVSTIGKLRHRIIQHLNGGKVLMITSVMENEGKSTVATNIALSMAKKGNRVLLIDCDLHKPASHKIVGMGSPLFCVNDVIHGTAPLMDAIVTEKHCQLNILAAKKVPNKVATDMINSEGMRKLIRQARDEFDYVVIDMAPMSVATDTELLMEHVDASLLIVCQNVVRAAALNRAIAALQKGKAALLGCILNNVYSTFLSSGEGHEAGYGHYGSYGKYGKYSRYSSNYTLQ